MRGEMITMIGLGIFAIFLFIVMTESGIERYLQAIRDREWNIVFGVGGVVLGLVMVYAGIIITGG